MHLSQLKAGGVICRNGDNARLVNGAQTVFDLAQAALKSNKNLQAKIDEYGLGDSVDLPALAATNALDCPTTHPDPAHLYVTGTGLTHLGSASTRDAMHTEVEGASDSMKMFQMGLKGGKPKAGEVGAQPEWFYKGNGTTAIGTGAPLISPAFALDGGEEPEIAGVYLINDAGVPMRLGFTLANEFSDHVTERINYLFLAHSKLRPASFGPELLVGELPRDIQGASRIVRAGKTLWEKPFLSGEDNMSHTIANLEHHHFKYDLFRQPGDLHLHMFGTATLSFADGVKAEDGDVWEISAPDFGLPLQNPLKTAPSKNTEIQML